MNDRLTSRTAETFGEPPVPAHSATFRPKLGDPRSLYIHVPFCRHRCGYCNFTLVAGRDHLIERFLNTLEREIGWLEREYEIETLFLGGGTPSHLSPQQLGRLGSIIRTRFVIASGAEVTAECNPNDLDNERMQALAGLGVNRISLGVQSLNPAKLRRLERDHSLDDITRAFETARDFNARVSMDMIFAAPEETLSQWQVDLESAISLSPDHVSTYELTYEKGTRFWNSLSRGELNESGEDLRSDMYAFAIERLGQVGLEQYEVSSFAQPDRQCRHNLCYWIGDPFFAFGPGAARFVDGIRETNHQSTMQYMRLVEADLSPVSDRENLPAEAAAKERLAIGLRMVAGLNGVDFEQRTGFSIPQVFGHLDDQLIDNGLLVRSRGNWRLSRRGMMLCDWIAGEIVGRELGSV